MRARIPELDGLRGVAILLVLIWHYVSTDPHAPDSAWMLRPLWSGVDLFFVLSGFLIGGILIDARHSPRLFSTFYGRRAARIIPLYWVLLGIYALLIGAERLGYEPIVPGLASPRLPAFTYLLFLQNFWMASTDGLGALFLAATWSLAVEEQFYLVLPIVIRRVSTRTLTWICLGSVVAAIVFRRTLLLVYPDLFWATYLLMPSRMDALMLGVFAAIIVRNAKALAIVKRWPGVLAGVAFTLFVIVGDMSRRRWMIGSPQMATWGYTVLALFYTLVLLLAVTQTRSVLGRALRFAPLRRLGEIAYGVYLIHQTVLLIVYRYFHATPAAAVDAVYVATTIAALVITLALASLSWRFFERPIVRAAHRLAY